MNPLYLHILQELDRTPKCYLAVYDTLLAAIRWAIVPQPSYAEIDKALDRLEALKYLTLVRSELKGKRYAITDLGRAMLAE